MKGLTILGSLMLSLAIMGCNSTTQEPTFKWSARKAECTRPTEDAVAVITADNMGSTKNERSGCFGGNSKFCGLSIYQVMVESFNHGAGGAPGYTQSWGPSAHNGNIKGIMDNLDYIKSTGVNTIWITPLFYTEEIPGQDIGTSKLDGTGYYTSDYFKIDPKFGTKEELKMLVEKAHSMGMYVLLDGAFGHFKSNIYATSPNGNKMAVTKMCRQLKGHMDLLSLKYAMCADVPRSIDYIKEVAAYWIKEVKIDGWRLDQAYQLEPKYWKEVSEVVISESAKPENSYLLEGKKVQPLGYMVAEIWSSNPRDIEASVYTNNSVVSAFNFPLREQLVKTIAMQNDECNKPAKELNSQYAKMKSYSKSAIPVMFLGNHDLIRFGDALQRAKYEEEGEFTKTYYDAHKAALSFIADSSGPIGIYYGDEVGSEVPNFVDQPQNCADEGKCDDHVARTEAQIKNLTPEQIDLKNYFKGLMDLRKKHSSLVRGTRTFIYGDDTLYIDLKENKSDGDRILYILNTSTKNREVQFTRSAFEKLNLTNCTFTNAENNVRNFTKDFKVKALSGNFFEFNCK